MAKPEARLPQGAEPLGSRIEAPDPFSPEALRVAPDAAAVGVRPEVLVVPVRKPGKQEWFRAREGEAWRLAVLVVGLRGGSGADAGAPALGEGVAAEGRLGPPYICPRPGGA